MKSNCQTRDTSLLVADELCEHDAKAKTRLTAELLRFDEVLDEDASIRFDDTLRRDVARISGDLHVRQADCLGFRKDKA